MFNWDFAIKKTRFAAEQERADVKEAREVFIKACEYEDANEFIFLDESGLHLGMNPLYGRAKRHERLKSFEPFNKGSRVTMIAAIGATQVQAATFGEWHVDGEIFHGFIQECLVPTLQPNHVVLMDNLSTHKVAGIREMIEATGARLVYLPPYSPDLSPIELCWSKLKTFIRKHAPRTFDQLRQAICDAFKSISINDLRAWFEHCGYLID